jgi:hypothetical protein
MAEEKMALLDGLRKGEELTSAHHVRAATLAAARSGHSGSSRAGMSRSVWT